MWHIVVGGWVGTKSNNTDHTSTKHTHMISFDQGFVLMFADGGVAMHLYGVANATTNKSKGKDNIPVFMFYTFCVHDHTFFLFSTQCINRW